MLISQRKAGETITVGDDIEIRIISVRRKVVLGIIAPQNVKVTTRKLSDFALENTLAAAHNLELPSPFSCQSEGEQCVVLSFTAEPPKLSEDQPIRSVLERHEHHQQH